MRQVPVGRRVAARTKSADRVLAVYGLHLAASEDKYVLFSPFAVGCL